MSVEIIHEVNVMNKIKTLIAMCILVAIVATCALSAAASITSTTSVIWNANETQASAKTVGSASANEEFYITAYIYSYSTEEDAYAVKNSKGSTSTFVTAGPVNVTYPSPIPLVRYEGSHGTGSVS